MRSPHLGCLCVHENTTNEQAPALSRQHYQHKASGTHTSNKQQQAQSADQGHRIKHQLALQAGLLP
jgi:hypothetical protein